jgi:hypothetical protein
LRICDCGVVFRTELDSARALTTLQYDPLDLIERDLVVAAIIQLGGARALMRGHLLSIFQQAAVEKVDGDPGRAERATFGSIESYFPQNAYAFMCYGPTYRHCGMNCVFPKEKS